MVSGDGLSLWRSCTNMLEFLASQLTPFSLFSKRHLKPQANICGQPRPTGTVGSRKDEEDFPMVAGRSQGPEAVESGVRCIPLTMNSKEA